MNEFPSYIEPRPRGENHAYTAAHLAGSTHKVLLHRKLSSTKGNAQGKSKLVSYVPLFMLEEAGIKPDSAHPESNPHVTVNAHTKQATHKQFRWSVR